jgi:hypothetical protein
MTSRSSAIVFIAAVVLGPAVAARGDDGLQPLRVTVSPGSYECEAFALTTADVANPLGGLLYVGSSQPRLADERTGVGAVSCEASALGESRATFTFGAPAGTGLLGPGGSMIFHSATGASASAVGAGGAGGADVSLSGVSSTVIIFNPNPVDVELHVVRDLFAFGAVSNGAIGYEGSTGFPELGNGFSSGPRNRDATGELFLRQEFGPNGCVRKRFMLTSQWPEVPVDFLLDSPIAGEPTGFDIAQPPTDPACQAARRLVTIVPAGAEVVFRGCTLGPPSNIGAGALTTIDPGNQALRSGYGVSTVRETCLLLGASGIPAGAVTLEITAHSPLDLLITDAEGRRTGFDLDRKQIVAGIPGARYTGHGTEPQTVAIPYPAGAYDVGLIGTGTGAYTLTLRTLDHDGQELDRREIAGTITPGDHQHVAAHVDSGGGLGSANRAPIAVAGADQVVECAGPGGTAVTLNGAGSSDPDGDALSFEWREAGGRVVGTTAIVPLTLPTGRHVFTLTVDDGKGGTATDDVVVTIQDTEAPTLTLALSPARLWPPNHQMVPVTASVGVTDRCDPAPTVTLVSISSSEPDSGREGGDIQGAAAGTDDPAFALRAERAGAGQGRTYTVRYAATDAAGNRSEQTATVVVPHDQH